jgi:hypothetical protein
MNADQLRSRQARARDRSRAPSFYAVSAPDTARNTGRGPTKDRVTAPSSLHRAEYGRPVGLYVVQPDLRYTSARSEAYAPVFLFFASFKSPPRLCASLLALSSLPSVCSSLSPVTLPAASLIAPLALSAAPLSVRGPCTDSCVGLIVPTTCRLERPFH